MDWSQFSEYLPVFGRAHPMLLHMPIGLLLGLGMIELWAVITRRPAAPRGYAFVAAVCAVLAAGSGWVLHTEPDYVNAGVLTWHERLGIATASGAVLMWVLRMFGAVGPYRMLLLLTLGAMVPAGHFGAEMTHGKGFLLEPLNQPAPIPSPAKADDTTPSEPAVEVAASFSYAQDIAPVLGHKCTKCHGERKSKGKLQLHSVEAILNGGESGPAIVQTGVLEDNLIHQRISLPLEDDDHMPPEEKVQLTASEKRLINSWLAAGAPFEAPFEVDEQPVAAESLPVVETEQERPVEPQPQAVATAPQAPPQAAIDALRSRLIHVQAVESGSTDLWVDFAAPAETVTDSEVMNLLPPLAPFIAELSLARTKISDECLPLIASMPHLARLDLRSTAVTAKGLGHLASHPALRELVLSNTQLDDAVVDTLAAVPGLQKLWVWNAGMTDLGLAALREALPAVEIDAGDLGISVALETEGDLSFSGDAPAVDSPASDAPAADQATTKTPVNKICPVSGKPVDPRYTVEHDGRVIGFCCPKCPQAFLENPAKYLAKIDTADPAAGG